MIRVGFFFLAVLLSQSALCQQLGVPQKCRLALRDSALFEDAEATYGCNLKHLNLVTQTYVAKLGKFKQNFCEPISPDDLSARRSEAISENREQYQATEHFQGEQKAQAVFCQGLNSYSLRSSNFPD